MRKSEYGSVNTDCFLFVQLNFSQCCSYCIMYIPLIFWFFLIAILIFWGIMQEHSALRSFLRRTDFWLWNSESASFHPLEYLHKSFWSEWDYNTKSLKKVLATEITSGWESPAHGSTAAMVSCFHMVTWFLKVPLFPSLVNNLHPKNQPV